MSDTSTTLREPKVTEAEVKAAVKGTKLADPKTIAEITKMVNRWAESGGDPNNPYKGRPLHTWCRVHGTKAAMTAIVYFEKRLAEYGTVFKLLTQYTGRGGKATKAATTPKAAPAPAVTAPASTKAAAKPARTDAPRATSSKAKFNPSSEVIEEDEKGNTTRRRHTIEDKNGTIVVQYDEFPQDKDKANQYIIGDSQLRMECMA